MCHRCGERLKGYVCTVGDRDLTSEVPDEVLAKIISMLPTDDGIRTQTLSLRWSKPWQLATLNLDDRDLHPWRWGDDLVELITSILLSHPGPARRFSVTCLSRVSDAQGDRYPSIANWFQSPALDKIEELCFCYLLRTARDPLPPSALRFTNLRFASYGNCHLPEDLDEGISFPHLRKLTLQQLTNTESTLHALLSACPTIRSLFLVDNKAFRKVRISSPSLKTLGVSIEMWELVMEELIIVDAPIMIQIITFVFLPIENMTAISSITFLQAVKIFSISATGFQLSVVMDMLKCFPCLEKLYFTSMAKESGDQLNGDPSIECVLTHLKEIVLRNYRGRPEDVSFARFFISHAKELKSMEFRVPFPYDKQWEVDERRRLPKLKDRASKIARFKFVPGTFFKHFGDRHFTHDLSIYNPFEI
ncbi:hypothetical protein EJB05_13067, partial [Eragrostis curvula]